MDIAASGEFVLEPDLQDMPPERWPAFTPAALELGLRAVFAVPLQVGVIRLPDRGPRPRAAQLFDEIS